MGATNALVDRTRRPGSRQLFARAAEIYAERFSDPDGRDQGDVSRSSGCPAGRPHASQQKPLKPGSAKVSLTTILKIAGTDAGDGRSADRRMLHAVAARMTQPPMSGDDWQRQHGDDQAILDGGGAGSSSRIAAAVVIVVEPSAGTAS